MCVTLCVRETSRGVPGGPQQPPKQQQQHDEMSRYGPLFSFFLFIFFLKDHHRENRSRTIFLFLLSCPFRLSCHTKKNRGETIPRHLYNTRRNGVLRAIDLRLWSTIAALFIRIFLFEIFPGKTPTKWRLRIYVTASGVVKADGDDDAKIDKFQRKFWKESCLDFLGCRGEGETRARDMRGIMSHKKMGGFSV